MNKFPSLFLLILMICSSFVFSENEIVVQLESENRLAPLYLTHFKDSNSGFDKTYIQQLEKVLRFDLGHNGMTYLVSNVPQKENLVKVEGVGIEDWKKLEARYLVLVDLKEGKLNARIFEIYSNTARTIEGIALSGLINEDRKKIHQVADTIHKALFGIDGIATTRILYTVKTKKRDSKEWLSDIWEADYDGGNAVKLIQEGGYCVTPVYIPPASGYRSGGFFYVSYLNGQPKIFYGSSKGGEGRRLSYLRGNQLMPAISRQRDKIAFISDVTGNPDLFIQSFSMEHGAIGKPRQIFAARQAVQGTPTFSPDGQRLAFVSNKDGAGRIYVMDIPEPGVKLKDIKPKLISRQIREGSAPCWSPDGKKLAYCGSAGGNRQIWVYDFEKGQERQLTQGAGNKENPTWAPNSLHLIFNSTDTGDSELFLINLNQPQANKIAVGSGEKHYPCWEPRIN